MWGQITKRKQYKFVLILASYFTRTLRSFRGLVCQSLNISRILSLHRPPLNTRPPTSTFQSSLEPRPSLLFHVSSTAVPAFGTKHLITHRRLVSVAAIRPNRPMLGPSMPRRALPCHPCMVISLLVYSCRVWTILLDCIPSSPILQASWPLYHYYGDVIMSELSYQPQTSGDHIVYTFGESVRRTPYAEWAKQADSPPIL